YMSFRLENQISVVSPLHWLDPTWVGDLEGSALSRTFKAAKAVVTAPVQRAASFANNTIITCLDSMLDALEQSEGEVVEIDESGNIAGEGRIVRVDEEDGEEEIFYDAEDTTTVISRTVDKVKKFGNSAVGKAIASNVVYMVGSAVGRAALPVADSLFENSTGMFPIFVLGGAALGLVLIGNAKTDSGRNWTKIATATTLVAVVCLQAYDGSSGMAAIGDVIGGCMALKAVDYVTGSNTPLLDLENPSGSHLVNVLPSVIVSPVIAQIMSSVLGPVLGSAANLAAPSLIYYAAPINQNVVPLLSEGRRIEVFHPTRVLQMLLGKAHERGLEGLAESLAALIVEDPKLKALIEANLKVVLTKDNAYNIVIRMFNEFSKFIKEDKDIQTAIASGDVKVVEALVFYKLNQQFPALRWLPEIVSLRGLSQTLAASVVGAVRSGEAGLIGCPFTDSTQFTQMEGILAVYLHGFLAYSAVYAMAADDSALTPQEMQLFYRNLAGIVGQLYIERLPIPQIARRAITGGVDKAIEVAIPAEAKIVETTDEEEAVKPTGIFGRIGSIFRLAVNVLILFFASFFYSKPVQSEKVEEKIKPVADADEETLHSVGSGQVAHRRDVDEKRKLGESEKIKPTVTEDMIAAQVAQNGIAASAA
ncbi:MAG: hypothetical protein HKM07_02955, partial [Chlamydiae bacterium]|nr:hypothetical protein [Chlamydiota bacterium]